MTIFDQRVLGLAMMATLGLAGCAGGTDASTGSASAPARAGAATHAPFHHRRRRPERPHRHRVGKLRTAGAHGPRRSALSFSTASNSVVQPQPPPGSCHARGSGLYARPDPRCTPGALNPAVSQATIDHTICVSGWTETVRPPESVTESEKAASMAAYGDGGSMGDYEYDHFVPLELGGATNDARNLWPEPGATPNPKDGVENELHDAVCSGQISLASAQREIVRNWTKLAPRASSSSGQPSPVSPSPSTSSTTQASCTATASYSSSYGDYDIYVHSNQPGQEVTVTDRDGHRSAWHTDSSGYADVYFKSGGYAPGRQITVHVGAATCSGTL